MKAQAAPLPFGVTPAGEPVSLITLDNGLLTCQLITYGAAIRSLWAPDRNGVPVDVVLGYDTLEECTTQPGIHFYTANYMKRGGQEKVAAPTACTMRFVLRRKTFPTHPITPISPALFCPPERNTTIPPRSLSVLFPDPCSSFSRTNAELLWPARKK